MTHVCYAIIPSGRTYANLFPCTPYKSTDNPYGKASQRLAEQQLQRTLQTPTMPLSDVAADGATKKQLMVLPEAMKELQMDFQCTLSDPEIMTGSLTSTKFCSKQALRRLASQLKPAASKISKLSHSADHDSNADNMRLQDLLHKMASKAAFESSRAIPELQTPALLSATSRVWSMSLDQISECTC